jgi:uncharacterized protein involved in type VI secretion and phage assembly
MAATAPPTSGVSVLLDGANLDLTTLLDVQIRDSLQLPDTAVVRLRDPTAENVDSAFRIGQTLEVRFAALDETTTTTVFKGEIVALEPEFTEGQCVVAARAYDLAWRLNRHRTSRTFQNQKAEDMVRTIALAANLTPGVVESTTVMHEFFQQSMETDWEFCWRLARMHDYEFTVDEQLRYHFRPRTRAAAETTLTWGDKGNLLAFRPRMSGMGQVTKVTVAGNDPKTAQQVSAAASRTAPPASSDAVAGRSRVAGALGAGEVVVADRVVATTAEARQAAQATLDRLASSFVEAEGRAKGDPKLRSGKTVRLAAVGQFSGEYVLAQTVHTFKGRAGYTTAFTISGSSPRTISELVQRTGGQPDWASSLVVGIVTNTNDPERLGRVRVKFPALGSNIEGWWARVAAINAASERGAFMLPQAGDEVVVAFEHGDTRRPIVLGSLYNGATKVPADLVGANRKARFGVKSDDQVHLEGKQAMTLRTGEKLTVEVNKNGAGGTGNYLLDAKGGIEEKAAMSIKATAGQSIELDANQSVTIKGKGTVTIEASGPLKLKGATVDIEGTGMVNVKGPVINLG